MADELTPTQVLQALSKMDGPLLTSKAFPQVPFVKVKSAVDTLKSREMISYKQVDREEAVLTPEAQGIATNGSHEAKVWEAVQKAMNGLKISDLPGAVGKESAGVGQGKAMKNGWIKKDGDTFRAKVESIQDVTREQLQKIQETNTHPNTKVVSDLKKRKLITLQKVISFEVEKGPKFSLEIVKEDTDLTAEMIASGAWKTVKLKPYNFKSLGAPQHAGALHPLNKVRHEFRQIFFEMGFEEMPTDKFVETGFWNFDALFVPQQHPARDLQDTFYISDPAVADRPRPDHSESQTLPNYSATKATKHPAYEYER